MIPNALGVSFAVKSVDQKARRFAGLASTWDLDLGNDVIHKGAFSKTLNDWRQSKRKVVHLLDSHKHASTDDILGKMVDAQETDVGLEAEFELRDTQKSRDALNAIEGGFLDGLSIGYQPIAYTHEKSGGTTVRHLTEIKLHEISLVAFPMNEGARVDPSSVKSLLDAAKAGQLTHDEWAELLALHKAADTESQPETTPDAPKGIAPDDPRRIALEHELRALQLRRIR